MPELRRLLAVIVIVAALLQVASPAFAWDQPICNPKTGEVTQPGAFSSDAKYQKFLKDHPGTFPMSPGSECKKPHHDKPTATFTATPTPVPPTPTQPTVDTVAAPTPTPTLPSIPPTSAPPPSPQPSGFVQPAQHLDQYCHYEPTTGLYGIRWTTDLGKTLNQPGNVAIDREDVCIQPVPTSRPTATATPTLIILEIAARPEPVTPPVATPTPTPEPQPPVDEQPPTDETPPEDVPPVPGGLPNTGGDGCSYYGTCVEP